MCGIAGIWDSNGTDPVSPEEIEGMLGALFHRGPNASGIYIDDRVALGHNRLSIIDLSSGTQPIHNEDENLWITFNGEIFNYLELRQDLLNRGHRFYTSTDTEVILHLFEEKGEDCLGYLNGQFAFAIWDKRRNELFLARDRVGINPLHYTIHKGRFIFSSEIKAIFTLPGIPREIDPIAMDQVFTFWTTLQGRTSFRNIFEIPPGNYLKATDRGISLKQYWEIPCVQPDECLNWPEHEFCEKLDELITDSVRIRLRADVKVGCYISGGLDSSAVTTIVKKRFDNELRTFGILFEDPFFDESEFQNLIVAQLDTDHTSFVAQNSQIGDSFPAVVRHCEKPLLRTAPVPLYLLSNIVNRNGYKVVLTGEGADEVFCGYNIFKEAKIRAFWAKRPDSKCRPLLIGRLYPYIFKDSRSKNMLQSFFATGLDQTGDPLYSHLIRWQNTGRTKMFFSEDLKSAIGEYCGYEEIKATLPSNFNRLDVVTKAQYLEMSVFLSNYLLSSQGDRVAMAHSLELRPPFLDHRIVEFAARVPISFKIRGLNEKYLLKQVFKKILPERILRRPKHPYRAPVGPAVSSGSAGKEVLSDSAIDRSGLFNKAKVKSLLAKAQSPPGPSEIDSMALAGILSSQLIYAQFVSGFPFKGPESISPALMIDYRTGCARKCGKRPHGTLLQERNFSNQEQSR